MHNNQEITQHNDNEDKAKSVKNILTAEGNTTLKNSADMMLVRFVYPKNNRN